MARDDHRRATDGAVAVPPSLEGLLCEFRGCLSAWTFPVFCALACGLVSQTARRMVCGMLVGAGLSQTWSHHRAHRFFSHARWSIEQVSAVLARLVVRLLVATDAAVSAPSFRSFSSASRRRSAATSSPSSAGERTSSLCGRPGLAKPPGSPTRTSA